MGVSLRVVAWLRSQSHDVVHLRDEALQRLPDAAIFTKAQIEKRIVLTFDLDFGEIAALTQPDPASVVVFRLRNARADHVIARLDAALEMASAALAEGAVVLVEEARIRVRALPIGRTNQRR